jgi:hypothetical protein
MRYFWGRASCNKTIVDFNLLAVLLYILSTRVGEIRAHVVLVHKRTVALLLGIPCP